MIVHATSVLPAFEIIKVAIARMFDSFEQHNGEHWPDHDKQRHQRRELFKHDSEHLKENELSLAQLHNAATEASIC
jgi:hypothetical protein